MSDLKGQMPDLCMAEIRQMYGRVRIIKLGTCDYPISSELIDYNFFDNWCYNIDTCTEMDQTQEYNAFNSGVKNGYFTKSTTVYTTSFYFTEDCKSYLKLMLVL